MRRSGAASASIAGWVLCGFPHWLVIAVKMTVLVVVALAVSAYASGVLTLFWVPRSLPVVWIAFCCAALAYGGPGLLLGVLVDDELAGFFLVIMISLIDTSLQNAIGNPLANGQLVVWFPAFAPMQLAVAGGFTDLLPLTQVASALAWPVGFVALGLLVLPVRTRASVAAGMTIGPPNRAPRRANCRPKADLEHGRRGGPAREAEYACAMACGPGAAMPKAAAAARATGPIGPRTRDRATLARVLPAGHAEFGSPAFGCCSTRR